MGCVGSLVCIDAQISYVFHRKAFDAVPLCSVSTYCISGVRAGMAFGDIQLICLIGIPAGFLLTSLFLCALSKSSLKPCQLLSHVPSPTSSSVFRPTNLVHTLFSSCGKGA